MKQLETTEPSGVVKLPKKKKVSDHQLDRAAREIGMVTLKSQKIRNYGVVGRFLEQVGIIEYGNGQWVASAEALSRAIGQCVEIVLNRDLDLVMRGQFIRLQLELCKALDANTAQLVDANISREARGAGGGGQNKPFTIGQPITPIQLNVYSGAGGEKEEPKV